MPAEFPIDLPMLGRTPSQTTRVDAPRSPDLDRNNRNRGFRESAKRHALCDDNYVGACLLGFQIICLQHTRRQSSLLLEHSQFE